MRPDRPELVAIPTTSRTALDDARDAYERAQLAGVDPSTTRDDQRLLLDATVAAALVSIAESVASIRRSVEEIEGAVVRGGR